MVIEMYVLDSQRSIKEENKVGRVGSHYTIPCKLQTLVYQSFPAVVRVNSGQVDDVRQALCLVTRILGNGVQSQLHCGLSRLMIHLCMPRNLLIPPWTCHNGC